MTQTKADWLRSEIEKLEDDLKIEDLSDTKWQGWTNEQIRVHLKKA